MALQRFLSLLSGRMTETLPVDSSTGAADAGKLVATDSTGRISETMMPVGLGADVQTITTSEALAAGAFVNVFNSAGTLKARNADASAAGKEADGFVLEAVASGQPAKVYFEGRNTALVGLTLGARIYLSASTPGACTDTPPAAAGNVVQYLGRASGVTSMAFEATDGVILA